MPCTVGVGRVLARSAVCTCATNALAVPFALRCCKAAAIFV